MSRNENCPATSSPALGELTDITHDSAWNATDDNQPISMASIVATLPNAAEIAGFLHAH